MLRGPLKQNEKHIARTFAGVKQTTTHIDNNFVPSEAPNFHFKTKRQTER